MISRNARVCILDYGCGNINSVYTMFKGFHDATKVSNEENDIREATHLVLPGVGAFAVAMEKVKKMPAFAALEENVLNKQKLFLGICVGMQVLADYGHEYGVCDGLGWIPGSVKKIDAPGMRLPHVGWNNVEPAQQTAFLDGLNHNADFYYVHSYYFDAHNKEDVVALTTYGSVFPAIVHKDNIYGVQFHPEKSQRAGVRLLKNFLSLS